MADSTTSAQPAAPAGRTAPVRRRRRPGELFVAYTPAPPARSRPCMLEQYGGEATAGAAARPVRLHATGAAPPAACPMPAASDAGRPATTWSATWRSTPSTTAWRSSPASRCPASNAPPTAPAGCCAKRRADRRGGRRRHRLQPHPAHTRLARPGDVHRQVPARLPVPQRQALRRAGRAGGGRRQHGRRDRRRPGGGRRLPGAAGGAHPAAHRAPLDRRLARADLRILAAPTAVPLVDRISRLQARIAVPDLSGHGLPRPETGLTAASGKARSPCRTSV
ncbi:hypothetical protein SALBM217S_03840 [Streptomyces griseoloalbus]